MGTWPQIVSLSAICSLRGEAMKRLIFVVFLIAAITLTLADTNVKQIIAFTPQQVRWFTPSYYNDGRERAQLFGTQARAARGLIVSRCLPANVSSRIRTRRTNW